MKYCRRDKFMTPEEVALLDAADRGEIDQRTVRISRESLVRMNQENGAKHRPGFFESSNDLVVRFYEPREIFLWL